MEMPIFVPILTASEISSPFTRFHRNEYPQEFWLAWFSPNQWMRNLFSPPPPPWVTRPFLFALLSWALSLRGIVFCLRNLSPASLCCARQGEAVLPHRRSCGLRALCPPNALLPFQHYSIPLEFHNLHSCIPCRELRQMSQNCNI